MNRHPQGERHCALCDACLEDDETEEMLGNWLCDTCAADVHEQRQRNGLES
jgi:hypothetical protein